ncbi:hypothetical protein CEXT_588211 [Caerostris extrusa]|uniref:Ileal sodium/bile acid cotransporter n=1 Tax=Caerostris extrusa TaxID=172846 RepID=A0AAV4Q1Y6_CAEEX|nr:hypothetical protein CEXT_588211 [Caerostris extrusa]
MDFSNITAKLVMERHDVVEQNTSDQNLNDTVHFVNEILDMNEQLKPLINYLLLIVLILIMLSVGCEVSFSELWNHIRKPIGLSIGIISQFGIKPLAAFAVLLAAGVEGLPATGVLIISCCPGGVLSNTFTYFSDGDLPFKQYVSNIIVGLDMLGKQYVKVYLDMLGKQYVKVRLAMLCIAMTTASTIMAMGMLPANIWLYGRHFESITLIIPYQKMALSLLIVTSPIAVGMLMKRKLPRIAKWTTKLGTYTGLLLMFICVIIEIIIFPDMFTSVPLKLYAIIIALPGIGLGLGYGIAALLKQKTAVCKTIAIECGIQNFPLALTVIALSFPLEVQGDIVLLPWLYGFAMIVGCSILCGIYQIYKRYTQKKIIKEKNANGFKDDPEDPEKEDLMHSNGIHIQMKPCEVKLNGNNTVSV